MAILIPAILATTEEKYKADIEKVNSVAPVLDGWVHIDLMDGIFVPNKSIDLSVVARYTTLLKKEAHLMIKSPAEMIHALIDLGFERIVIHLESDDVASSLEAMKNRKLNIKKSFEIGLAVSYNTSLEQLGSFLDKIDVLMIMPIQPGFQGQEFNSGVIEKINKAKEFGVTIEVDGGVSVENAKLLIDAGVENLVVGSRLLNGSITQNLEKFQEVLHEN